MARDDAGDLKLAQDVLVELPEAGALRHVEDVDLRDALSHARLDRFRHRGEDLVGLFDRFGNVPVVLHLAAPLPRPTGASGAAAGGCSGPSYAGGARGSQAFGITKGASHGACHAAVTAPSRVRHVRQLRAVLVIQAHAVRASSGVKRGSPVRNTIWKNASTVIVSSPAPGSFVNMM